MISSRPLLLLPLILVLAWGLRWVPSREIALAPDERDLGASRWLIDDPETCQHLRRIELGIAGERVPEFDRFVNHPSGGEIPALPLYDTLLAGAAQRFTRAPSGEVALSYVDESELEDFVVRASPLLGVLAVLCVFLAARTLARGPYAAHAAIAAALVFALHPASVRASSAGVLDASILACALLAIQVRSTVRSLRSDRMPTAILDALIAGALSGLLVSATAAGLFLFIGGWVGFLWAAARGETERRAAAVRSGLLYCVVAAFVGRMPLAEGPWESGPEGVLGHFSAGVSSLLLISTSPFIVLALLQGKQKARPFQVACFVVALGVMLWLLPSVWRDLEPAVTWFGAHHGEIARVMPGARPIVPMNGAGFELAETVLGFLALIPCWLVLKRRPIHAADLVLIVLSAVTFLLAAFVRATTPFFVVSLALSIGATLDASTADAGDRARFRAFAAAGGFVLLLSLACLPPFVAARDPALREERIAFVAGLRWMRTGTESGGPWNAPRSPSEWGVLSTVADGPLVQYHARRPALASPAGALASVENLLECGRALYQGEIARLVRFMQGQRAAYVVVGAKESRRARELCAGTVTACMSFEELCPFNTLASAPADAAERSVPGLTRVYASTRRVGADGRAPRANDPAGPVVSIYRLTETSTAPPQPELRAR